MTDSLRLFIALELPRDVLDALQAIQDRLRGRTPRETVRWTRPEGVHLTLKFLGETPAAKQPALTAAMQQAVAGRAPLRLHAAGLGCFPNLARPRVVWIGVQGHLKALQSLRDAVEGVIAPLGYPTEDRPFSPHLTLGRVRRDAPRSAVQTLGAVMASATAPPPVTWTVTEVGLFRSELKPTGAVYTLLHRAPLSREAGR